MNKRHIVFLILVLIIPLAWNSKFFRSGPQMANPERPIVTIKTRVLDSMNRYIDENELYGRTTITDLNRKEDLFGPDYDDDFVDYLTARASDHATDEPGGIIIDYDHPDCPVILPAGRQFKFSYVGGYIDEIEAIIPLEPMSWDEMQTELKKLIAMFDNAGWVRSTSKTSVPRNGIKEDIAFEDFLDAIGPKWAGVGYWKQCDNPAIVAYLQIRHYNSSSPGSFMPPNVLSEPLAAEADDTFLFLVRFHADYEGPVSSELTRLRDARRIEETGRLDKGIPLSTWLDDPEWRPEDWDGEYIK